jgi:hypothetical protein
MGGHQVKCAQRSFWVPSDAYQECPECRSPDLIKIADIHVLCDACNWDSANIFVESGGMDALFYEYEKMQETRGFMKKLEDAFRAQQELAS